MAKVTKKTELEKTTKKAETVKNEKVENSTKKTETTKKAESGKKVESVKKEKFDSTALGEALKKMLEDAGIQHKYTAPKNNKTAQFSSKGNVFCISKNGARVYLMEKTYNSMKDSKVLENVTTGHKSAQFAGATVKTDNFLQFVKELAKSYKEAENAKKVETGKKEDSTKKVETGK